MNFRDIPPQDIKLKLLTKQSFFVDNVEIPPFTIGDISKVGMSDYFVNLELIIGDGESLFNILKGLGMQIDDIPQEIMEKCRKQNSFEFVVTFPSKFLLVLYINAWRHILKDETIEMKLIDDKPYLICKQGYINADNVEEIIEAIRVQHCAPKKNKEDEFKPANAQAERIINKIKEARKKWASKSNNDSDLDMATLISSVASRHPSINFLNINELSLYQLYDAFNRLVVSDNYDKNILALIQGAEISDPGHWAKNINNENIN